VTNEELFQLQMTAASREEDSRDALCHVHWHENNKGHTYNNPVALPVARILKRELQKRHLSAWIEVE
jgi:hypothetical protein